MKVFFILFLLILITVLLFSSADGEKTYTIKLGTISPELTPEENYETANAYRFRDYVEEKSNGQIKVAFFPAG